MIKILVAEDDQAIRELIAINLQMVGYEVIKAIDGQEAKEIIDKENLDLVLLDVTMPKIDGFSLIHHIKNKGIPVIFVTAKESVIDRVKGLRLGAEDYIVKPFEAIELIARIEVVLRRYGSNDNIIKFKNIEICQDQRLVKLDGKPVELTLKEYHLLLIFLKNKNIALSREQILEKVWSYDYLGESRTVDIHVQRLREKLDLKDNIKTIFKVGYRIED